MPRSTGSSPPRPLGSSFGGSIRQSRCDATLGVQGKRRTAGWDLGYLDGLGDGQNLDAIALDLDHRQHKGLNNRAVNSHQPTRVREKVMRRFKSARHLQRFASTHDQVANLFIHSRYNRNAAAKRAARSQAFAAWGRASGARSFCVAAM